MVPISFALYFLYSACARLESLRLRSTVWNEKLVILALGAGFRLK